MGIQSENKKCWLYYDAHYDKCGGSASKGWIVGCKEKPRSSGTSFNLVSECNMKLVLTDSSGEYPPFGNAVATWLWCGTYGHGGSKVNLKHIPASSSTYKATEDKGCSSYVHMDDARYGRKGGEYTLDQCAAAVKQLDGREGCKGNFFYFESAGYCNCPKDNCDTSDNGNAGSPGQLFEFKSGI